MFKTNSYFEGKVMSIALQNADGPATIGAMKAGEYEFGTATVEHMTVVSGKMEVMLPGEAEWTAYTPFQTFIVPANIRFKVKMETETAYICHYK